MNFQLECHNLILPLVDLGVVHKVTSNLIINVKMKDKKKK